MSQATLLQAAQLRRRCDPSTLAFATTDELEDLDEILGQVRAKAAVDFGIGIRREGYNLYVLGPAGAGKQTMLRQLVGRKAADEPSPADWCYVYNFDAAHQPRALKLPAGRGAKLRDDMRALVEELLAAIPAAFESDEYRARTEQIEAEFTERHEKGFRELGEQAASQHIALLRLPTGFSFAPVKEDGEVITPAEFGQLNREVAKYAIQYRDRGAVDGGTHRGCARPRFRGHGGHGACH